jgi:hypothetical protein
MNWKFDFPQWSIYPQHKSSACPHCTPRCPHGYPADAALSVTWGAITTGGTFTPANVTVTTNDGDDNG